jgi:uncharacterized pyridoxamine 5'-phosphate oxidase family protein
MNKQEVIDMIKDAAICSFATTEGDQPRVRPMMPYLTEQGDFLLAVLSHSRTIAQVKKNPNVEMCYLDRKMWFARVTGKARVSEDLEKRKIVWNNIPMLRQYFSGPEDKSFVLIEIATQQVEAMTPQQKVPDVLTLK